VCNLCGKTFTFLPPFSPPYTHYSLIARSQALRRYFLNTGARVSEIIGLNVEDLRLGPA
jgi:integrase